MTTEHGQLDRLARRLLGKHPKALGSREIKVLEGLHRGEPTSRDAGAVAAEHASFGERLSDRVAAVGGSWRFIIAFSVILLGWMILNSDILSRTGMTSGDQYGVAGLESIVADPALLMSSPIRKCHSFQCFTRSGRHPAQQWQMPKTHSPVPPRPIWPA